MGTGKGKGGRPTLYKPEYCEKVIQWGKEGQSRTWIAAEIDVTRETLNEWAKVHADFSDALSAKRGPSSNGTELLGKASFRPPRARR